MSQSNGTGKLGLPAHKGTDQWFAMGDSLAEQPPKMLDTRELAQITTPRARRAERLGLAAGLGALVVIALVLLVAHFQGTGSRLPAAAIVAAPANPVAAPANPVAAPANPVAAPANPVAAPANSGAAPSRPAVARVKHKKPARKITSSHRR